MEPVAAPAAAAQPAESTPVTISATLDAASRGDFSAFDTASTAAQRGKPLPSVEATEQAAPASPAPAERTLSKRQEEANNRTRAAVDAATADLRAELDRVKAQLSAPPARPVEQPAAPAAPAAPTVAEWKRLASLPDAPKLADFESVEEHTAAMSFFIATTIRSEEQATARERQTDESRAKFLTERGQEYGSRLSAAREADPDIVSKIAPAIMAARPLSGLSNGEHVTFANLVAETGLFSEDPAGLYVHLTANPADAQRIAALPSQDAALRALAQLDGRLTAGRATAAPGPESRTAAPAAAAPPSTITAAPPPPPTVTRAGSTADPQKAALARGDFGTFDRIEMEKKRARHSAA